MDKGVTSVTPGGDQTQSHRLKAGKAKVTGDRKNKNRSLPLILPFLSPVTLPFLFLFLPRRYSDTSQNNIRPPNSYRILHL
jgi:hypothetical protein